MNISISVVEVIQSMLAPGIMISACGLLLLGMNNKYSLVVNRIRLLNEERRRTIHKYSDENLAYPENIRLESISKQITSLVYRVKLVRNAVFSYTIAVALFVLTSLFIGLAFLFNSPGLNYFVTIFFLIGMLSVLVGIIFAAYETIKGYEIVNFEVSIDE